MEAEGKSGVDTERETERNGEGVFAVSRKFDSDAKRHRIRKLVFPPSLDFSRFCPSFGEGREDHAAQWRVARTDK